MTSNDHILDGNHLRVLTIVMTVEYSGFQYAGFQRQSATHHRNIAGHIDVTDVPSTNTNDAVGASSASSSPPSSTGAASDNGNMISSRSKMCKRRLQQSTFNAPSTFRRRPEKRANKISPAPITVQHQIEAALQRWTNLSVAALRVRGAGRTDKGVHASGQVVAFDVPLRLLDLGCTDAEEDGAGSATNSTRSVDNGGGVRPDGREETLSEHSILHLRSARDALAARRAETSDGERGKSGARAAADRWQIRRAITTRLPEDIALRSVRIWTGTRPFEPRRGIARKTYIYKMRFRQLRHLSSDIARFSLSAIDDAGQEGLAIHPICNAGPHLLRRIGDQNSVWLCPWPLNPALLQQACQALMGEHDFTNFVHKDERRRAAGRDTPEDREAKPPHLINLLEFEVNARPEEEEKGDDVTLLPPVVNATFSLKAKGFHRSMARNLVGFAVDVARGLRYMSDIPLLLMEKEAPNTCTSSNDVSLASMVHSAPACGLSLCRVEYEHDHFL